MYPEVKTIDSGIYQCLQDRDQPKSIDLFLQFGIVVPTKSDIDVIFYSQLLSKH